MAAGRIAPLPSRRTGFAHGVAVDPSTGNIAVSDSGARPVLVFTSAGTFVTSMSATRLTPSALIGPSHVAIDAVDDRNIVLADRVLNRMRVYANTFGTDRALPAPIDTLDTRATILLSIACLLLGVVALRQRA